MKPFLLLLITGAFLHAATPAPTRVLKLWEGKPPGDFTVPGPESVTEPKPTDKLPILRITNVAEPRLELYEPAAEKRNGGAVVIVPGGGFGMLASGHEGADAALWFRDRGFVAGVLQHRCPTNGLPDPAALPAQDAQRAISLVRAQASKLGIRPDRVGLFGFSAGGQVALTAASNSEQRLYPAADETDATSCRPDFLLLLYPWRVLAENSRTALKPEIRISGTTPPCFIAQAADDAGSLAEGSVLTFLALRKAGVPAELHIYATGGHGFGMLPTDQPASTDWPGRAELWLKARGLLSK